MITRVCKSCKKEKSIIDFPVYKRKDEVLLLRRHKCTKCYNAQVVAWQEDNPDAKQRRYVEKNWNMTLEEYRTLLNTGCEVCGTLENLVIDHDHACCPKKSTSCGKCIRGVLCNRHNLAEGCLKGNPEEAYALAEYMEKHWKGEDL